MGFRSLLVCAGLAPLLTAFAASSGQTAQAEPEPRYDAAATIDIMAVVADEREVASSSPLGGVHLLVRPETAKSGNEPIDVYLCPADFLKEFGIDFVKGDRLQIVGSKVKYGGNPLILAREVRRDTSTVYLRDQKGQPYWKAKP